MRSLIVSLGVGAVIVAVMGLGILEIISTGSKPGAVWAEVAQKVQASPGVVYRMRETHPDETDGPDYAMVYSSPPRERADHYKAGCIVRSVYADYDTHTVVHIVHEGKRYVRDARALLRQSGALRHWMWIDPKGLVQKFSSRRHKKLETRIIEGVPCEGLETTDPAFFRNDFPMLIGRLNVQLWVSIQTRYPVQVKADVVYRDGGWRRMEGVADQFQWGVELDPNELEPRMPEGYTLEEWPS